MESFFTKLAMLVLFLLAVSFGWAALTMVFKVSLVNIILGILATFFLLRALEIADEVNKLGPYAEDEDEDDAPDNEEPRSGKEKSGDEHSPDEE
jgi:hypothetical protein